MNTFLPAAAVLFVTSVAIYVGVAWWRKGQADLDRHIAEALDVANTPDLAGNVVFFDRQGVTR